MIDCGYQTPIHFYQRIMKDNYHHSYLSPNDEVLFDENKIKINIVEDFTPTFFNFYN